MTAYKLLSVRKNNTIRSLFINRKLVIPTNMWIEAKPYKTKGYKFRPGWHCLLECKAPHLGMKNRKWFKVKIKDWEIIKRPKSQGGIWLLAQWLYIEGEIS